MGWPRYVAPARSPPPVREREAAKDENPARVKLTVRCTRCRQINVVTAKDYGEAV